MCGMETGWGDGGGIYLVKTDSTGYAQLIASGIADGAVSGSTIRLFPNPVSSSAMVAIPAIEKAGGTFTVFNTLGLFALGASGSINTE